MLFRPAEPPDHCRGRASLNRRTARRRNPAPRCSSDFPLLESPFSGVAGEGVINRDNPGPTTSSQERQVNSVLRNRKLHGPSRINCKLRKNCKIFIRRTRLGSAAGLLGTTAEAGLLHFRGAFHNPAMLLPVTMPPVAAALLVNAAAGDARHRRPFTRFWLGLTSLMGIAGVGFHILGVSRAMGGWRNWRQNMVDGPPIPAPPSFVALALAGLAALALMRAHPDE